MKQIRSELVTSGGVTPTGTVPEPALCLSVGVSPGAACSGVRADPGEKRSDGPEARDQEPGRASDQRSADGQD